jgi:hypothetical protein
LPAFGWLRCGHHAQLAENRVVIDQLASVGLVDTNPDLLLQLLSCDQQTDCFTDRLIPGRKPA